VVAVGLAFRISFSRERLVDFINRLSKLAVFVEKSRGEVLSEDPRHVLVLVARPEPFEEGDVTASSSDDNRDMRRLLSSFDRNRWGHKTRQKSNSPTFYSKLTVQWLERIVSR
jgi:hypothetical protein